MMKSRRVIREVPTGPSNATGKQAAWYGALELASMLGNQFNSY